MNNSIKPKHLKQLHDYRQKLRKDPILKYLFLELTLKCNENCLHCGSCKSKCPYGLDTPTLLEKNLADYKQVLSGEVTV